MTVPKDKSEPLSKTSLRILLVDDDDAVRQLIAEALSDEGHRVAEATQSAPALTWLTAETFDLMITDLGLPGGMTGQQLASAAQALQPGMKLLGITGYPDQAKPNTGALEVLAKPFTLTALCAHVAGLVAPP